MARRFAGDRLVLATHNPGKVAELQDLLAPHGVEVVSAGELGLLEPVEDGGTFAANAAIKARAACEASGLPALADDSGLAVAALGGEPGVDSALWAGPGKDFAPAIARVLRGLEGRSDRAAAFVSVLCLAWPDGHEEVFEGRVEGTIAQAPKGEGGFGYDPLFVPQGKTRSFSEMSRAEKQAVSHRGRAVRAMLDACFK